MTKIVKGQMFAEPTVVFSVDGQYRKSVRLPAEYIMQELVTLFGCLQAVGSWRSAVEPCLLLPVKSFRDALCCGDSLRTALQGQECIAVMYRHPRNPQLVMVGLRPPPNLFVHVWDFIPNEELDSPMHRLPMQMLEHKDGLVLNNSELVYGNAVLEEAHAG